jgi:hypothetical protein
MAFPRFGRRLSNAPGVGSPGIGSPGIASPARSGDSDLLESEVKPSESDFEPGDHERFSHYVLKEKIVESAVTGKAVRALCGKKWVPTRDPMKFPICPVCKEIHSGLRKGPDPQSNNEDN